MESDWEVELGAGAPVIDACWAGLVDLRVAPERVHQIVETGALTGLAEALVRLNAAASSVWTAKCDVWCVEEAVDPCELDAEPDESAVMACYIDVLPCDPAQWKEPERAVSACRAWVVRLRAVELRACRADLIVRLAQIADGAQTLGITAYLTACGEDEHMAGARLSAAASALADTVEAAAVPAESSSPVQ